MRLPREQHNLRGQLRDKCTTSARCVCAVRGAGLRRLRLARGQLSLNAHAKQGPEDARRRFKSADCRISGHPRKGKLTHNLAAETTAGAATLCSSCLPSFPSHGAVLTCASPRMGRGAAARDICGVASSKREHLTEYDGARDTLPCSSFRNIFRSERGMTTARRDWRRCSGCTGRGDQWICRNLHVLRSAATKLRISSPWEIYCTARNRAPRRTPGLACGGDHRRHVIALLEPL